MTDNLASSLETPIQFSNLLCTDDSVVGRLELYQLSNGLKVCVIPRPGSQITSLLLRIGAGSLLDLAGREGTAHLLEHLVFCGTKMHPGREDFDHAISEKEGRSNAATGFERTAFEIEIPSAEFEFALERLSEIVFGPLLAEKHLEFEREIVLSELKNSYTQNELVLIEKMFPNRRLGQSILGNEQSLRAISLDDILKYHQAHYHASNATLYVAGNTSDNLLQIIEKRLKNIPTRNPSRITA